MRCVLWRTVRAKHAAVAFTGEGAARFPGRYNAPGIAAVYLADCAAGCALEVVASYVAPEAIATHVLFEVEVWAPLVDLTQTETRKRYGVTLDALVAVGDFTVSRRVGGRLLAERRAGAVVPAATVARASNVVFFPQISRDFRVVASVPLGLDTRVLARLGTPATGA